MGLFKLILENILADLVIKHKDSKLGLDKVESRVLLASIVAEMAPMTVADARNTKVARDKSLAFHTNAMLAVQFLLFKRP